MKFLLKNSKFYEAVLKLVDEKERAEVMDAIVYGVFAIIAAIMSIVNVITDKIPLLISTSVFMVICVISFILITIFKKAKIAKLLFLVGMIILFGYFIVTGGTDNFSIVWVLLLPALGLFFFGIPFGSLLSAIILVIMLVCFFVPGLAGICTDYGKTFEGRFPIVYVSCYVVSLFLEIIRELIAEALKNSQEQYKKLYSIDQLTGLYNRYAIDDRFKTAVENSPGLVAVAIGDIDFFKQFNDTYGHQAGDEVLIHIADIIRKNVLPGVTVTRWGGEEFLIIYPDAENAITNIQNLNKIVASSPINLNGAQAGITMSFGMVTVDLDMTKDFELIQLEKIADNNLYKAKETGRNRVIASFI